ncbi:MAG: NAD(P)-dependent alcohol dehydrogenase [Acidobacteria bacterium]|nr:NAD(P)-dependent alcohol dehydrogenase [Acidobacteriota bacterium]
MRAVQFDTFGGADVLHVVNVPMPPVAAGEVLVEVEAAGVNPHDILTRSGVLRMIIGRHFPFGTGLEFAGEVVGHEGGSFRSGRKVWGSVPQLNAHPTGAIAEYVAVPVDRIAPLPPNLSCVEGASLVVTATTALRGLRREARLRAGENILVRGAGGGVGLAAVQIAAAAGADITTLSRTRDFALLTELGAAHTLDDTTVAVGDLGSFDVIFDTVGTELLAYQRHLAPGGRMVAVAFASMPALAAVAVSALFGPRRIRAFCGDPSRELLDAASALVVRGQLRATVSRTYTLDDTGLAQDDLDAGGTCGKQVIVI